MRVEATDVTIKYLLGEKNIGLKDFFIKKVRGEEVKKDFTAVQNVSFSLEKGDFLGIVGTNGSGKSTLLKVVSGIMAPTGGRMVVNGRVAALLELTAGFDGDMTVKENIYLRGALLGYTRAFVEETYPVIIDFAELHDFVDSPLRHLSSGMKSRLAFAIASLVKPDILILDEVLSVGDGAFKKKSEAKMQSIIDDGAITLFVSHSTSQVKQMANKVLWLDKGKQMAFGGKEVCDMYEEFLSKK